MKKKIRVNMLSMADSVDGQGVGSAYLELIKLLKEDGKLIKEITLTVKQDVKEANILELYGRYLKNMIIGNIKF